MSFFKIYCLVSVAAALAGCAGEKITDPTTTGRADTASTPTPQPQPQPVPRGSFYASTGGSSAGDGSVAKPWDLRTALASGSIICRRSMAGCRLWMRLPLFMAVLQKLVVYDVVDWPIEKSTRVEIFLNVAT